MTDLDLSSPGTTNGNTIEPKNNWPTTTNTSDSTLSLDGDKNGFINFQGSIQKRPMSRKCSKERIEAFVNSIKLIINKPSGKEEFLNWLAIW